MRVTNVVRERINLTLDKALNEKITELYAEKNAREAKIKAELDAICKEANDKAQAIMEKYPDACLMRWGDKGINYIQSTANVVFDKDAELNCKAQELRHRKKELAMDLEIRCTLEKNADDFFKMLAEATF